MSIVRYCALICSICDARCGQLVKRGEFDKVMGKGIALIASRHVRAIPRPENGGREERRSSCFVVQSHSVHTVRDIVW